MEWLTELSLQGTECALVAANSNHAAGTSGTRGTRSSATNGLCFQLRVEGGANAVLERGRGDELLEFVRFGGEREAVVDDLFHELVDDGEVLEQAAVRDAVGEVVAENAGDEVENFDAPDRRRVRRASCEEIDVVDGEAKEGEAIEDSRGGKSSAASGRIHPVLVKHGTSKFFSHVLFYNNITIFG